MSRATRPPVGQEAIAVHGWWHAHRFLVLRRISQLFFLGLFLLGPWAGIWLVKGNLTSSLTLGVLPLSDPFVFLQTLAAGHPPLLTVATGALAGAVIVALVYALIGGRVYCSWVCPVNPVTDAAHWLHTRLGLKKGWQPKRGTRLWVMAMVLAVSALTGSVAWEMVNPISMLHRGLIFGMGFGWTLVAGVFIFDLVLSRRGWCGHLCPVGAFYGLLGERSLLRVSAANRAACDDCMDCFDVCPEAHVISPALRGSAGTSPLILSRDCTNCGRCIDVCPESVFRFTHRFDDRTSDDPVQATQPGATRAA
ncbi:MAG: quinol dehydrogenase ferredoxin subunit NapH [Rhodobacteraceae bacterium]|nr:quinol dehydrogenase ferredoxin subunit NapH [Paracoccaceae bacterium]